MKKFSNKKFLITGGKGFLGTALANELKRLRCKKVFLVERKKYNLVREKDVERLFKDYKPNIVFHLAASVGGIGINKINPGRFFYENAMMNLNIIHHAYLNKIEKIISTGTVSSYPEKSKMPLRENDLWKGYPETMSASYGIAKRIIHTHSISYKKQYNFKSILVLLTNLYGPNDNFNPKSSHVIASLIKKVSDAKKNKKKVIEVWGRGNTTRDFAYIDDIACGLVLVAKKYNKIDPINLASGKETSIKELVKMISQIFNYKVKIKWLKNKPIGFKKRYSNIKLAKKLGFKPTKNLKQGLIKTINWYKKNN